MRLSSWTTAVGGNYTLTAVATDNLGATTVSAPVHVAVAGRTVITGLTPLTQYQISAVGMVLWTRVSSSQGVLSFDSVDDGPFEVSQTINESTTTISISNRFMAMVTPAPGETFLAPAALRLVAEGFDPNGVGPGGPETGHCLDRVDFFIDDSQVGTMSCADAEYGTFKIRVSGVAAGTHAVWARGFAGTEYYDSRPHRIIVLAEPTYGRIITLDADLDISGQDYDLTGTLASRIKVVGNGHRIIGTPTRFSATYVDFSGLGDGTSTDAGGLDVTTSGDLIIDNCRFYENDVLSFTTDGGDGVTITHNLFSSNSTQPLGQYPDYTGGLAHGSWPALNLTGSSAAAKVLQANNFGAGWVDIRSPNWTIGGPTDPEGNVAIGARVGFKISESFTGTISHNYTNTVYYGGWSQANNYEMGNIPGVLIEHNVIEGSSWPVRGLAGEFRYNLVTGDGLGGFIWTETEGPPNIHHNVLRGQSVAFGAVVQLYGAEGTLIRNNTLDLGDKLFDPIALTTGSSVFNSNLVMHSVAPAVQVDAADVTADYNAWFDPAGALYADGRTPAHDVTGDPAVSGPPGLTPFSWEAVWNRTKTVTQILADFRIYYTPTALVIDAGDTSTYGAGNDIGAIGAGIPNAADRFGN